MTLNAVEFKRIVASLRKAAAALREPGVRYCVSGSVASWARGGPETVHDVDLIVAPAELDAAVAALEGCGMRAETPPEGWLVKLWDGDVLVDVIHTVTGYDDVAEIVARADVMRVASLDVPVAQMEDVLTPKILAFDEHYLDYAGALRVARALREQIDWRLLRDKTSRSPYARGFFCLLEALDIIDGRGADATAAPTDAGAAGTRRAAPEAPPGAGRLAEGPAAPDTPPGARRATEA